jgi:hypothetical protein
MSKWTTKDKLTEPGYYWYSETKDGKRGEPVLIRLSMKIERLYSNYKRFNCDWSEEMERDWSFLVGAYDEMDELNKHDLFWQVASPPLPESEIK